ncbi:beta-N-acetylhexosaminidase [candidate division KSB1 bacterium]|nr:beta-N-acetylhexosaminidase [candidate division KSB1 bacterium]
MYVSKDSFGLVPLPMSLDVMEGTFKINSETVILTDNNSPRVQEIGFYLNEYLSSSYQLSLRIKDSNAEKTLAGTISLTLGNNMEGLGDEGYELIIHKNHVSLKANTPAGLFYGVQTIIQLLNPQANSIDGLCLPSLKIVDRPRYSWRGMHLDVCRHFFPKEFIKKYIDLIAMHKMNTFHWHLTEDQGWRIEIKKYPNLTEIGAWRKETLIGHSKEKPQKFDGIPHGGFYTQEEIREIVKYARERFVTIVPEIELPGHATAALAAYPEFSCTGGPFEVETTWGIKKDVYCPGMEETFTFLENVLTEVIDLFPAPYIHIGGDECPKDRWRECDHCQARIKQEGLKDEDELQSYFIKRIERFLSSKNKRLVGWDEILEGGLAPNSTVMSWRGIAGGIAASRKGHDVVMTPTSHCYFDYYQAKGGEPLAIGGFLPLKKVYSFEPTPVELEPEQAKHILGAQGNVWTEYIARPEHVEYMALPRMSAMAEVLWSPKEKRHFKDFQKRMRIHYRRLDQMDVNYHAPKKPV